MTQTDRPNVVYIMADQMAAPLLHMYNKDSVIKTPNLDRLAEQAVVFDSAYCNSPLCAPSRFTMCTGQLPSKIGGYDNGADFSSSIPTYAHYLRLEGYHTALAGKMHFVGPDQLHGFEERLTPDIYPGVSTPCYVLCFCCECLGGNLNWETYTRQLPAAPKFSIPKSALLTLVYRTSAGPSTGIDP